MAFNTDPRLWLSIGQGLASGSTVGGQIGGLAQSLTGYQDQQAQQMAASQQQQAALQAKQLAAQQKNQTLMMLEKTNPELAQAVKAGALSPNDAFAMDYKQRQAAKAPKKWDYREGPNGSLIAVDPYDPSAAKTVMEGQPDQKEQFKTELDTMKTYRGEDAVKTYQATRDAYEKVRTSASLDTAQGDIGLVYGFMKMLDPTSVVREGEYATAENSGGISDTVMNLYNKALSGERLTPEQRIKFTQAAEAQYRNTEKNLQEVNQRYTGLADQYGIPTDRFIEKPKTYEPLKLGGPPIAVPGMDGVTIQRSK